VGDRPRELALVELPATCPSADHHRRAEGDLGRAGRARRGRPRDVDSAPSNVGAADSDPERPERDSRPFAEEGRVTEPQPRAAGGMWGIPGSSAGELVNVP